MPAPDKNTFRGNYNKSGPKKPVKYATAKAVRTALGTMPEGHVHCRTLGHVWAHREAVRVLGGFRQVLGCQNCQTEKVQMINRRGEIQESRVYYAEGYLLVGLGRLRADTKSIVRLASLE